MNPYATRSKTFPIAPIKIIKQEKAIFGCVFIFLTSICIRKKPITTEIRRMNSRRKGMSKASPQFLWMARLIKSGSVSVSSPGKCVNAKALIHSSIKTRINAGTRNQYRCFCIIFTLLVSKFFYIECKNLKSVLQADVARQ